MKPEKAKPTPEQIARRKERAAGRLHKVLANFAHLPDEAVIDIRAYAALKACSVPTMWRHLKLDLLPAPVRRGPNLTGWRVGDVRADLNGLPPAAGTNPITQHARNMLAAQRSAAVSAEAR